MQIIEWCEKIGVFLLLIPVFLVPTYLFITALAHYIVEKEKKLDKIRDGLLWIGIIGFCLLGVMMVIHGAIMIIQKII
jgi:uncharacterized membrane protein (GlpM family)